MKRILIILTTVSTFAISPCTYAQSQLVIVTDGTNSNCIDPSTTALPGTCPALLPGAGVEMTADDAASKSRVTVKPDTAFIQYEDATTFSETGVGPNEGYTVVDDGTVQSLLRVRADQVEIRASNNASSVIVDSVGTAINGDLSVTQQSTLNGIDNQNAGITNAGLITGVTPGSVAAGSTEAVNGSQLFATNTNVAAAQTTANTAVSDAAAAQSTADTALANAATAQTTADTAVSNAAAAQSTANTALTNAATAQATANTAVSNATAAQSTADTALTNAATAQATADTAATNAASAQTTATNAQALAATADANATAALTTASTADVNATAALTMAQNSIHYDSTANTSLTLNSGGTAVGVHNIADGVSPTDAVNMRQLSSVSTSVSALGTRVSALETALSNTNADLRRIDAMAGRGTAIATAIASIPPISDSQKFGFGVGVGTYDGRTAFSAAVIGRVSGNAQFRLNAGTTGSGKVAAGGGVTFGW